MRLAVVLLAGGLAGCSSAGTIIGVVAGAAAGGGTGNPVVGFGVGVGVAALSDYTIRTVSRSWHNGEQDAIAAVAGDLPEGGTAPWRIRHSLPIGNEHGQLQVVRIISNPLADCRQILFSVEERGEPDEWYTADVCHQAQGWKWATAEPAVQRWGFLQ